MTKEWEGWAHPRGWLAIFVHGFLVQSLRKKAARKIQTVVSSFFFSTKFKSANCKLTPVRSSW